MRDSVPLATQGSFILSENQWRVKTCDALRGDTWLPLCTPAPCTHSHCFPQVPATPQCSHHRLRLQRWTRSKASSLRSKLSSNLKWSALKVFHCQLQNLSLNCSHSRPVGTEQRPVSIQPHAMLCFHTSLYLLQAQWTLCLLQPCHGLLSSFCFLS